MSWLIVLAIFFGILSVCAFFADNVMWRIPVLSRLVDWIVKNDREG